ncbi:hypothetical protein HKCCE3408_10375 [Rhodobacterales bacterium HKCCE3408]|nr:hypothetical protein [Rhodobacterales bacterium HKCCE3408]
MKHESIPQSGEVDEAIKTPVMTWLATRPEGDRAPAATAMASWLLEVAAAEYQRAGSKSNVLALLELAEEVWDRAVAMSGETQPG